MMWSEKHGNELYVFRNGLLIYKKWLSTGRSVLLNNLPNYNTDKTVTMQ